MKHIFVDTSAWDALADKADKTMQRHYNSEMKLPVSVNL